MCMLYVITMWDHPIHQVKNIFQHEIISFFHDFDGMTSCDPMNHLNLNNLMLEHEDR